MIKFEKLDTLRAIDWGISHCVFVDMKGRVFSMGENLYGKTGLDQPSEIKKQSTKFLQWKKERQEERDKLLEQKKNMEWNVSSESEGTEDECCSSLYSSTFEKYQDIDPITRVNLIKKEEAKHRKEEQSKKNVVNEDRKTIVPTMIQDFVPEDDCVMDVQCGIGHSMAISN